MFNGNAVEVEYWTSDDGAVFFGLTNQLNFNVTSLSGDLINSNYKNTSANPSVSDNCVKDFETILTTLKFTKPTQGSSVPTTPVGQGVYTNSRYGFSVQYPTSLMLETTGLSSGGFAGQSAVGAVSMYVANGGIIERLSVNVSSDSADVGNCTVAPQSPESTGEHASNVSTVNINGTSFLKYQLSDLAAGQSVNSTVYRAVRNNTCYEIRDTISSTASNRLSAEENQKQSTDIAAASAIIGPIVQSFRFTN